MSNEALPLGAFNLFPAKFVLSTRSGFKMVFGRLLHGVWKRKSGQPKVQVKTLDAARERQQLRVSIFPFLPLYTPIYASICFSSLLWIGPRLDGLKADCWDDYIGFDEG
jgi:hypothetical protein